MLGLFLDLLAFLDRARKHTAFAGSGCASLRRVLRAWPGLEVQRGVGRELADFAQVIRHSRFEPDIEGELDLVADGQSLQ
ncbi:hypothetical protein [Leptolyngbya sp. 7M]|uniref:hypothetical protein n=1 Tax=Leptolyngbya sp. 7M TaxID=2812896 RepID=UPI001CED3A24|nr:hypothetical protein [Leptolyngbya sp. 7M]